MPEVINDANMTAEIIEDLIKLGWKREEAVKWAQENGSSVVNKMWSEYSRTLEIETEIKEQSNG